ncbi:MAG: PIG-L family deacetylase [Acidimicrobiia bacterium]|nr:PIG-L family deacetylase [Acidimicrobiia bacterium]
MAPEIDPTRLGPPEGAWLTELRRRRVRRWLPPALRRLVVVAPHPSDETLGAGGLVSLLHRRGWEITVLALTDGEAAQGGGAGLGERRRSEQAAALECLAPVALERLSLADGRLGEVEDLAQLIGPSLCPDTLCVAPWPKDGHPDHEAAGVAALAAAEARGATAAFVPIWAWHWQAPGEADFLGRASIVPLDDLARLRKAAALAAYRSQIRPLGREPTLPDHVLTRFSRPFEVLAR